MAKKPEKPEAKRHFRMDTDIDSDTIREPKVVKKAVKKTAKKKAVKKATVETADGVPLPKNVIARWELSTRKGSPLSKWTLKSFKPGVKQKWYTLTPAKTLYIGPPYMDNLLDALASRFWIPDDWG